MDEPFQLNQPPTGIDDDYERAAEWLDILADGKLDELTQRRFSLWFNGSERRREIFQRMSETWSDFTLTEAAQVHVKELSSPAKERVRAFRFTIAPQRAFSWCISVSIGVCIGVLGFYFLGITTSNNSELIMASVLATDVKQSKNFQLTDGSTIELSPTTSVTVNYSTGRRDLALDKGAAYFQVAHDKTRPFDVHIDSVSVLAVGTQFMIDRSANAVDLIVYEGVVELRKNGQSSPIRLAAGSSAHIENNNVKLDKVDLATLVDWRSGWIEIKNQSLGFLVEHLNRYSTEPILIDSADVKNIRVAGRFKLDSPEKTIAMLSDLYQLSIQQKNATGPKVLGRK